MTSPTFQTGDQIKRARPLADALGVSHINGTYAFADGDCLNEGADRILGLGSRVIKVIMRDGYQDSYPFHTDWPEVASLADLARTRHFRDLFSRPFSTFVIMAFSLGRPVHYFLDGAPEDALGAERQSMFDFAAHLLATYAGSGKTFVIQNWESDWVLTPPAGPTTPEPRREIEDAGAERMVAWCAARQAGIEQARREVGANGVSVLHALEVNLIGRALKGRRCAVDVVVPQTRCDLYSYSAWDTQNDPVLFREALSCLRDHAPPSASLGRDNVYVGEFGAPENEVGGPDAQERLIASATETALDWGARYAIYWQLYCNEPARRYTGRPTNADVRGFWLVRPDGGRTPLWDTFARWLNAQSIEAR